MLPHEVLLWAEFPSHYKYLDCLSCFQVASSTGSSGNDDDGDFHGRDIVGFQIRKVHAFGVAPHIGTGGPVPAQHPKWHEVRDPSELNLHNALTPFEEANMRHFVIDGPGGEVVTEVYVSDDMNAIKLRTNRGRECYWGEENKLHWLSKEAAEGEVIVGLSCCFGRLSGWSWSAKMHSHWKLSNLGVVTMKLDRAHV